MLSCVSGVEAIDDLRDSSGVLYFVSNEGRKVLILQVLADDIPEGTEVGFVLLFLTRKLTLKRIELKVQCTQF